MGLKKNCAPNNPNGRPAGSKNRLGIDIKTKLAEGISEPFVESIYNVIESITDPYKRTMVKIKLLEFFIPKPREQEDLKKEDEFRKTFMDKMFPKKE